MSTRPDPERLVGPWIEKAEHDLTNAVHTLTMSDQECPFDTVCFHAQQCVEKYVKALLVHLGVDFPKTHDIAKLIGLLPENTRPPLETREQERLTDFAFEGRYPGGSEASTRDVAEKAVTLARRAREAVRQRLPEEAL
jgi:HEPN domain-containing protein